MHATKMRAMVVDVSARFSSCCWRVNRSIYIHLDVDAYAGWSGRSPDDVYCIDIRSPARRWPRGLRLHFVSVMARITWCQISVDPFLHIVNHSCFTWQHWLILNMSYPQGRHLPVSSPRQDRGSISYASWDLISPVFVQSHVKKSLTVQ